MKDDFKTVRITIEKDRPGSTFPWTAKVTFPNGDWDVVAAMTKWGAKRLAERYARKWSWAQDNPAAKEDYELFV